MSDCDRPGARKISTNRGRLISNIWFTSLASPRMATNESPRLLLLIKPRSPFSTSTAARRIVESGAELESLQVFALRESSRRTSHSRHCGSSLNGDGTRKPADRSAGLLKGNLNPVCFSGHGRNDSRSHRRIGDTLGHTRYGTLRGSRWRQSGSGDGRRD
jgi:hypothetical protein